MAVFDREMHYIAASERWLTDYHLDRSPVGLCHYDVFQSYPKPGWQCTAAASPDGAKAAAADRSGTATNRSMDQMGRGPLARRGRKYRRHHPDVRGCYGAEGGGRRDGVSRVCPRRLDRCDHHQGFELGRHALERRATRLLGYPADEMIGQSVTRIIPRELTRPRKNRSFVD